HHALIIPLTGLLLLSGTAQAELRWSSKAASMAHGAQGQGKPMNMMQMSGANGQAQGHNSHNRRRGKTLFLHDSAGAKQWMITSTLERRDLELADSSGKLEVPSTGVDNYHALVATRQEDMLHESALRYEYLRGKPSGHSPSELLESSKLPLEIVPDPMAREHGRFHSQNEQSFIVRFNDKPVSGAWVGLTTSNRSELEATTDAEGRVTFSMPDDFKNVRTGRRNNRPGEFMIRTGYVANDVDGERLYRTNFTAPYYVNPSHWQSDTVGLFMLVSGFAVGLVLMRRTAPSTAKPKRPIKKGAA
ncbi:MAG: DUF4198 domain-containing protein, partial [Gammaproteobacteria bacterium]|nr:DUF4198 domain-containing protein [Gammaproteobacteria bacterium]